MQDIMKTNVEAFDRSIWQLALAVTLQRYSLLHVPSHLHKACAWETETRWEYRRTKLGERAMDFLELNVKWFMSGNVNYQNL